MLINYVSSCNEADNGMLGKKYLEKKSRELLKHKSIINQKFISRPAREEPMLLLPQLPQPHFASQLFFLLHSAFIKNNPFQFY